MQKTALLVNLAFLFIVVSAARAEDLSQASVPASSVSSEDARSDRFDLDHISGKSKLNAEALSLRAPAAAAMPLSDKFRYHFRNIYGPRPFAFSITGAAVKQARNSVPEWGQGMGDYGKRLASSLGQKSIKGSLYFSAGAILREDPRYLASDRSSVWGRALDAAGQVFVARTDSGGWRPGYSRFIGIAGSVYISRQWYPETHRTAGKYATAAAVSLGMDMMKNVLMEFWPDFKRKLRR